VEGSEFRSLVISQSIIALEDNTGGVVVSAVLPAMLPLKGERCAQYQPLHRWDKHSVCHSTSARVCSSCCSGL